MHTIKPSLLKEEIRANARVGLNTMIWGGPGIGKSEIPYQLVDFRAILFERVEVR